MRQVQNIKQVLQLMKMIWVSLTKNQSIICRHKMSDIKLSLQKSSITIPHLLQQKLLYPKVDHSDKQQRKQKVLVLSQESH